jgi:hypothetical protein
VQSLLLLTVQLSYYLLPLFRTVIVCTVLPISPTISAAATIFLSILITTLLLLRTAQLYYIPLTSTLYPNPNRISSPKRIPLRTLSANDFLPLTLKFAFHRGIWNM